MNFLRDLGALGGLAFKRMHIDELTRIIIGIAIKIHRQLGLGLLESAYQAALAYELQVAKK